MMDHPGFDFSRDTRQLDTSVTAIRWDSDAAWGSVARTCHEITLRCQDVIAAHAPTAFSDQHSQRDTTSHDALEHAKVGDPDPGTVNECRACRFEWAGETGNLTLWFCTRPLGHPGQHIASTGQWIVAVHPGRPRLP